MSDALPVRPGKPGLSVAHVVDEGAWGGLATFMVNLLSSQLADPKFREVHLVCDLEHTDPALLGMTGIHYHAYRSDRRLRSALKTSRIVHEHLHNIRPDLAVLHSSFPGLWGRLRTPRGWKVLYCAHGWAFQQSVSWPKRRAYALAEAFLSRRTDAIVSISASEFAAAEKAGVKPRQHALIRHGLRDSDSKEAPTLPMRHDEINLLFVGRFDRQKGLDILLEALDDPRLAHLTLWIVGRNIIGEGVVIPKRRNIHLLGWMENSRIDGIIRQMDAVVIPSRWEGFGLIALEAMRNGRPPVVSMVGGLREIVVDGVNGLFLNIQDIEDLRRRLESLRREDLRRMGEIAQQMFQERYRWDRCYENWRTLLLQEGSGVGA